MRIYCFVCALLFVYSCKSVEYVYVENNISLSPEMFGAKGDGISDDSKAFRELFMALEKKELLFKNRGWGSKKAGYIELKPNRHYVVSESIEIANKNFRLTCPVRGSTVIEYSGANTEWLTVLPSSINSYIEIDNIGFLYGGIKLLGALRGNIKISNCTFWKSKGAAISIADGRDESKNFGNSFGVVGWEIVDNEFHYCERGVQVESHSFLWGRIIANRFNGSRLDAISLMGSGVDISDNEFQSVSESTAAYISVLSDKTRVSSIRILRNRFGAEKFSYDGLLYTAPLSFISFKSSQYPITSVSIQDNYFYTNKDSRADKSRSKHAIRSNCSLQYISLKNNIFRAFNAELYDGPDIKNSSFSNNVFINKSDKKSIEKYGWREN